MTSARLRILADTTRKRPAKWLHLNKLRLWVNLANGFKKILRRTATYMLFLENNSFSSLCTASFGSLHADARRAFFTYGITQSVIKCKSFLVKAIRERITRTLCDFFYYILDLMENTAFKDAFNKTITIISILYKNKHVFATIHLKVIQKVW